MVETTLIMTDEDTDCAPCRLVIEPAVTNVSSLEVFGRIYDEGEAGRGRMAGFQI